MGYSHVENITVDKIKALASAQVPDEELKHYDAGALLRSMIHPGEQPEKNLGLELEVSRHLRKTRSTGPRDGVTIPFNAPVSKSLQGLMARDVTTAASGAYGSYTIETVVPRFLDFLYANLACRAAGATFINGLTGNVSIPYLATGNAAYMVQENTAPTEGAPVFGQIALSPKTVAAFVDYTRKLRLQSALDIEGLLLNHLMRQLACKMDQQALEGAGSSYEATGLVNVSGIGSYAIGTNGGTITYAAVLDLESDVASANAAGASLSYICHPRLRRSLQSIFTNSTYGEIPLWDGRNPLPGAHGWLNGYRGILTTALSTTLTKGTSSDCTRLIFGNFADLIIGTWSGIDLQVDPYTASNTGTIKLSAFCDFDIGARPASFSVCADARVS